MDSLTFAVLMPQLDIPLPEESVHFFQPSKSNAVFEKINKTKLSHPGIYKRRDFEARYNSPHF
jgi:hypothetical protein